MNDTSLETTQSTGGDSLLAIVALATIVVVALESGFIALSSWWALPGAMLVVAAAAGVVIYAIMRTIGPDTTDH